MSPYSFDLTCVWVPVCGPLPSGWGLLLALLRHQDLAFVLLPDLPPTPAFSPGIAGWLLWGPFTTRLLPMVLHLPVCLLPQLFLQAAHHCELHAQHTYGPVHRVDQAVFAYLWSELIEGMYRL